MSVIEDVYNSKAIQNGDIMTDSVTETYRLINIIFSQSQ